MLIGSPNFRNLPSLSNSKAQSSPHGFSLTPWHHTFKHFTLQSTPITIQGCPKVATNKWSSSRRPGEWKYFTVGWGSPFLMKLFRFKHPLFSRFEMPKLWFGGVGCTFWAKDEAGLEALFGRFFKLWNLHCILPTINPGRSTSWPQNWCAWGTLLLKHVGIFWLIPNKEAVLSLFYVSVLQTSLSSSYDQNLSIFGALPVELKIHMKERKNQHTPRWPKIPKRKSNNRRMIFPNCHRGSNFELYPSPLAIDIHQRPQKETKKNWKHATNDSAKPSPARGNETYRLSVSRNKNKPPMRVSKEGGAVHSSLFVLGVLWGVFVDHGLLGIFQSFRPRTLRKLLVM